MNVKMFESFFFFFHTSTLKIKVGFSSLLHWNFMEARFHLIFVVVQKY